MFKQISSFFEDTFSKHQCGFRKDFSTQQCLLTLLEKWKNAFDKGKMFGAVLTDLSKAFDCLNHELLIAMLNAYGFTLLALKLIHNYLSNSKQRARVNDSYSLWQDILFGVLQGSFLGLLLFNIFLADLFFTLNNTKIANCAGYTASYAVSNNIDDFISSLEKSSNDLLKWFDDNPMKNNLYKCHLLFSSREKIRMKVCDFEIENSTCEKLSGVHFDNNLNFDYHISGLCKKN